MAARIETHGPPTRIANDAVVVVKVAIFEQQDVLLELTMHRIARGDGTNGRPTAQWWRWDGVSERILS